MRKKVATIYDFDYYPVVRGGYRTWASTIQFRGTLLNTRDIDYPVGKYSRLKDICRIVMNKTMELGAQWYFGHRAVVLTQDDTGRVTGAITSVGGGKYVQFTAVKGVVNAVGNMGDLGFKLGVWAGGHLDNTPIKPMSALIPIDEGPFYGAVTELSPRDWNSRNIATNNLCGLHTDEDMNVLDNELEPIPGLYAVGATMGYRFSVFYPTPCGGNFIGSAMTLGRLLGQRLAAE